MSDLNDISTETIFVDELSSPAREGAALARLTPSANTIESLPVRMGSRYKFLRSIGFGGMKSVLLVYDNELRREVAMASMPDWQERPAAIINRFIMEARLTAGLEHPNIVPVHDLGRTPDGIPYFTMKYLKGQTLASLLRRLKENDPETVREYPLTRLLRIYLRICNAIAFAHSQGIIHLDLKPENVHVGEFGEVQVIDWGLARPINRPDYEPDVPPPSAPSPADDREPSASEVNGGVTRDGVAKGTPGFMAPEQAAGRNREKDQRTDIYTLGCILYNILTFEKPLAGKKIKEVLRATVKGNIKAPSELENPRWPIPQPLEAICLKAMERYPQNRYQSVAELRKDIIAFSSGYATSAEHPGPVTDFVRFVQRNYVAVLLVLLLAINVIGFFVFFYLAASGKVAFQ